MATNTYNVNALRAALVQAREDGNKKCIDKKMCTACGISEGYLTMHIALCKKIHKAVCEYLTIKHTPSVTDKDIKAAEQKIWKLWKAALSSAEVEKDSNDLKCSPFDVSDLSGFVATFADDRNDGAGFKAWGVNSSENAFRKKVETMLGIRIDKAAALTQEDSAYLFQERKLLKSIRAAEDFIEKNKQKIKDLDSLRKEAKSDEAKDIYKNAIEDIKKEVSDKQNTLKTRKADLETLYSENITLRKKFTDTTKTTSKKAA